MKSLPDAGRRPAALSVLLLAVAVWMSVPLRLLVPGTELDLGVTAANAVYVVENAAMAGTIVLAVGATVLRARRVLTAAIVVVGAHLLVQVGTATVQLVQGALPEYLLGTLLAMLELVLVLAGALLARLLHGPTSARRTGFWVVLAGALLYILWASVLQPVIVMMPYGGPLPGMISSYLLIMLLNLLAVAAAVLCGWASPTTRRIGAVLAGVVGVLGIAGAVDVIGDYGGAYGAVQIVQGLLLLAVVPFAVVAARRLAASRQAANTTDAEPQRRRSPLQRPEPGAELSGLLRGAGPDLLECDDLEDLLHDDRADRLPGEHLGDHHVGEVVPGETAAAVQRVEQSVLRPVELVEALDPPHCGKETADRQRLETGHGGVGEASGADVGLAVDLADVPGVVLGHDLSEPWEHLTPGGCRGDGGCVGHVRKPPGPV
jgi:hypothetical protein